MTRYISEGRVLLVPTLALLLGGAVASTPARQADRKQPLSEAQIYFELNDTDGDLGLHASIDGEAWTSLEIEGPDERKLLDIFSRGPLRRQGMTQLFFESAEPSFDELEPAEFFRRFPEGVYEIEARAQEGGTLAGKVRLSHVLAAPAGNITVNGMPVPENCDTRPLPVVDPPVVVRWDPVTTSHPEIGKAGPVKISLYQVFVERDNVKLGVDLPPTVTELDIPEGVTALGREFKLEIIARTATGNNTAVETCFRVR